MELILTHSSYLYPNGTFLQQRPKLREAIYDFLSRGVVRDSDDQYCYESSFLYRHSFNIVRPTWMDGIDGEKEFMPNLLTNLPDHLQFASFKEAVTEYVKDKFSDNVSFEGYTDYDSFLIEHNLQFIPYQALEICYRVLGIEVLIERDIINR